MTATATKTVDAIEACSVQSPDRKLTCDLKEGHPGSHVSNNAPDVAWFKRKFIENLEPRADETSGDDEAPAAKPPSAEVKRLQQVWMDVVGPTVGVFSRPVEISDGVLIIEVADGKASQEMSFLNHSAILEVVAQMNLRVERLVIRARGGAADSDADQTIETTVDGKTSKVVLNGTTGKPIENAEPVQPRLIAADLRAIEQQLARVNADLIEAAVEKKEAADRFKEAQNRQNAVVAELVRCINGEQQLPFGAEPSGFVAAADAVRNAIDTAGKVADAAADDAEDDDEDDQPELDLGGQDPEAEAIARVKGARTTTEGVVDTGKEPGEIDTSGPEN